LVRALFVLGAVVMNELHVTRGFFIWRPMPVIRSRKWICVLSSLPVIAGIPAAMTRNASVASLLMSVATWGYASWSIGVEG
jgi:hypothetical protein